MTLHILKEKNSTILVQMDFRLKNSLCVEEPA